MKAHARSTDPSTSHAAAASVGGGDLTENQRAVMTVMRQIGRPTLDENLVREYMQRQRALHLPRQSESGIRSRRSELAAAGKLKEGDKARMTTGRMGRTWSINDEGTT